MASHISERLVNVDLTRLHQRKDEGGKQLFRGTYRYKSGDTETGIVKIFPTELRRSATKEIAILTRLEKADPAIESAKVLDMRPAQALGFEDGGMAVLEQEIDGDAVALRTAPMEIQELQARCVNLFAQLGEIGDDEALIGQEAAYCGDISSTNVLSTKRGNFTIVDWGTRLGAEDETERVTRRYVAPEVVVEGPTKISFVHADTYSVGCLFARALLGREGYADLVPFDEERHHFLAFDQLKDQVDPGVHAFFRLALAHDPRDRSPEGAQTAGEHYQRLEMLFRGFH